jgi:hypothetical protein
LIVFADKRIENRNWETKHRGALLIHAGISRDILAASQFCEKLPMPMQDDRIDMRGAIIGVCDVVDCVRLSELKDKNNAYAEGEWCWILDRVGRLKHPIFIKGQLGLWQYDVPIFEEDIIYV